MLRRINEINLFISQDLIKLNPGPEEMDIMSSVHCSILIKALTYLYTKFGQESFIYTVANAQTNLYITHISKKAT